MIKKKLFEIYSWFAANIGIIVFLFLCALCMFSLSSCSHKPVRQIEKTEIRYIDSTIVRYDTTWISLPCEVDADVVYIYDTLYLETTIAEAYAVVDPETKTLKGKLSNKDDKKLPVEVKEVEKIVYRDSVVEVEKPVYIDKIEYRIKPFWKWYIAFSMLLAFGWLCYILNIQKYIKILLKKFI